ncbi:sodium-dependent nutrient amino acid transporter 1-like [Condylostylus longicornis]|uniref:sodium-dependent nutrient amino acid transporter 1-like n=1 Tax=Condylostylus longicornis TaxID=2530218 RepID=UPI00244E372E|nr:sodium-dependent nutrient amino acid transporter 1-like [Condylostylus longicornis]
METYDNPGFVNDENNMRKFTEIPTTFLKQNSVGPTVEDENCKLPDETLRRHKLPPQRDLWGKDIEFLLSCIAMSVGLGNVWRFPFTALENGGGAFLIPYLIVLFLVGKPIYFLEMIIGQFSSRGAAKVYDLCPAMRGVGIGQVIAITLQSGYYVSVMALCLRYLVASFNNVLPWSECNEKWGTNCIASGSIRSTGYDLGGVGVNSSLYIDNSTNFDHELFMANISSRKTSGELYFVKEILQEVDNVNDGIGLPNWELVICLFVAWVINYIIIIKGVKSSGKASYFLAIFPYIVLIILLIRAVTLPGSIDGIVYFIKPQWDQILSPKVWYAAVTQVFFSLTICFGCVNNYASYNRFDHNIYRDSTIVTLLDTFTSLLAGFTIFAVLGNLAHEVGTEDIGKVVKGGAGLAFISYPDAIAKFDIIPQLFSVLFFALLFVLGIGSNIGMVSCIVTTITDAFPRLPQWACSLGVCLMNFCFGLVYVTPGGQFMLNIVDYFGVSMNALILGILELLCVGWFYGVNNLCADIKFMISFNPGVFWRICWGLVTPIIMMAILIYFFVTYQPVTYKGVLYPNWAYVLGGLLCVIAVSQVPIFMIYAYTKQRDNTVLDNIKKIFKPKSDWGPMDPKLYDDYVKLNKNDDIAESLRSSNRFFGFIQKNIFG